MALDPGEHALYAGSASGAIYEVSLVGADPSEDGHGGGGRAGGAAPAAAAAAAAAGSSGEVRWRAMEGHSRLVTCLGFTGDAAYLVSGAAGRGRRPVCATGALDAVLLFMRVGNCRLFVAACWARSFTRLAS